MQRGGRGDLRPLTATLALLERLTGVEITRAWLAGEPRPSHRRLLPDER